MNNESKNFNTGTINASRDVNIGDSFYKSIEYKEIIQKIEDLEALIVATNDEQKRQDYYDRLQKEKNLFESFKEEIKSLAKTFSELTLNTERLKIAKKHFDLGEYKEARAVLNAKEVLHEFELLLKKKEELEIDIESNNAALKDKSNELLILAELTTLDFNNENRFVEAEMYLLKSLEAYRYEKNIRAYAMFLYTENRFELAGELYGELLVIYKELVAEDREANLLYLLLTYYHMSKIMQLTGSSNEAKRLLNLALFECDDYHFEDEDKLLLTTQSMLIQTIADINVYQNEYDEAAQNYEKALVIEKKLLSFKKNFNVLFMISLLGKLGGFYIILRQLDKVEKYLNEALQLFEDGLQVKTLTIDKYLPALAEIHLKFGMLHALKKEFSSSQDSFETGIEMYRKMLKVSSQAYLPSLARALGNFVKYLPHNKIDKRKTICEEAINIYENLPKSNEFSYNLCIEYMRLAKIELVDKKNIKIANTLFDNVVDIRRELCDNGDEFYKRMFLDTLIDIGTKKILIKDYSNSEKCFLEALDVCGELAKKDYNTFEFYNGRIHNNLGIIYSKTKKYDEADVYFSGAKYIFHELAEKNILSFEGDNPKEFYARVLSNYGGVKFAKNELLEALKLYDQSSFLYNELVLENPECFQDLAEVHYLSAITLEKMNEIEAAKLEIKEALDIYNAIKQYVPEVLSAYNSSIKVKERLNSI